MPSCEVFTFDAVPVPTMVRRLVQHVSELASVVYIAANLRGDDPPPRFRSSLHVELSLNVILSSRATRARRLIRSKHPAIAIVSWCVDIHASPDATRMQQL
jgi:hypothetical protein